MKDVAFARGAVVHLASVSSGAVGVNLDGCLSSDSEVNCRGNDSILVYRGREQSVREHGLQPFTGNVEVRGVDCYTPPPRPLLPPASPPLVYLTNVTLSSSFPLKNTCIE